MHRVLSCAAVIAFAIASVATPAEAGSPQVDEARRLLESGQAEAAIQVLDAHLKKNKKDAEGFLVRSSAAFVLGDVEDGTRDLDRALELDPNLRQGWQNRSVLQMAEGQNEAALDSLLRARELDPGAPDNDINIGAVRLMLGQLDVASEDFSRYLASQGREASAYYLVATNYAMNGYAGLAVQYLQVAISLDERARIQARTDPNFSTLTEHPRFVSLLETRSFQPAPGSLQASKAFDGAYLAGKGPLLPAVLDALFDMGQRYEPRAEVTERWAVIWGEMRIELRDGDRDGEGIMEVSAAPGSFSSAEWDQRTKRLFDAVFVGVQKRKVREP